MKVTYSDIEEAGPRVTFCGVTFKDGVPVEIDPSAAGMDHLLKKARANPFFVVGEDATLDEEVIDAVRKRGRPRKVVSAEDETPVKDDGYRDAV